MEIERKWLFDMEKVPVDQSETITHYKQLYLSIDPEVRVRSKVVENLITGEKSHETYMLCVKGEGDLTRTEIQTRLNKNEFNRLLEENEVYITMAINKNYYTIPIGEYELTVGTVDKGTKSEFSYGEIEFDSEEEALAFNPPEWFGKEVTNDKSYKMKNYWKRTRIDDVWFVYEFDRPARKKHFSKISINLLREKEYLHFKFKDGSTEKIPSEQIEIKNELMERNDIDEVIAEWAIEKDDEMKEVSLPVSFDSETGKYYISTKDVEDFIDNVKVETINERTTFVTAVLKNGFVIYETSTSASVEGYDEEIGTAMCMKKIKDKIFEYFGFVLKCIQ